MFTSSVVLVEQLRIRSMDNDREDTVSIAASNAGDGSEGTLAADSVLAIPERSKNGESTSSESGVDVDKASVGRGSGGSEGEKDVEPVDMVRRHCVPKSLSLSLIVILKSD